MQSTVTPIKACDGSCMRAKEAVDSKEFYSPRASRYLSLKVVVVLVVDLVLVIY